MFDIGSKNKKNSIVKNVINIDPEIKKKYKNELVNMDIQIANDFLELKDLDVTVMKKGLFDMFGRPHPVTLECYENGYSLRNNITAIKGGFLAWYFNVKDYPYYVNINDIIAFLNNNFKRCDTCYYNYANYCKEHIVIGCETYDIYK
jgi:hypothetical protein